MVTKQKLFLAAAYFVVLFLAAQAQAIETVTVSTDVWIRSIGAGTTFENDDVAVRGNPSDTRYGILEFDLSGVSPFTLGNATSLVLTSSDVYTTELSQTAFLIDTSGGTAASSMTWNAYQAEYEGNEAHAFQMLGVTSVGGPLQNGDKFSTFASAPDRAAIQGVLNDGGLLTIVLKPLNANSDVNWDDDNTAYGSGIRAVLNLAGDLGDFDNSGGIDLVDYGILRNHMQAHLDGPVTYEDGDIDFDGEVDLDDFGQFKALYPGGAGGLQAALDGSSIPEPSSIALGVCGLAGLLAIGRRSRIGARRCPTR